MEREQLLALHVGNGKGCAATLTDDQTIGRLSRQKCLRQHRDYVLNLSVNGVSTIFDLASWII